MANWVLVLLGGLAVLNVSASVVVARAISLGPAQRGTQLALVWLVPVLGPVVVLSFLATDRSPFQNAPEAAADSSPGDETTLAQGQGPCGCAGSGGDGGD